MLFKIMTALFERKKALEKEIDDIAKYFYDNNESSIEFFDAFLFNTKMDRFVELTTIALKEIVKELDLNGDNIDEYQNIDATFNLLYLEFKKIYDKKILLKKESDTLREIIEITAYLGNFMDGNSNVIFNSLIFHEKLEKYVELSMTLKTVINELKTNGDNIEIYQDMSIVSDSCYQEFKKFLDEKNKML